jgi:hypothetical protein
VVVEGWVVGVVGVMLMMPAVESEEVVVVGVVYLYEVENSVVEEERGVVASSVTLSVLLVGFVVEIEVEERSGVESSSEMDWTGRPLPGRMSSAFFLLQQLTAGRLASQHQSSLLQRCMASLPLAVRSKEKGVSQGDSAEESIYHSLCVQ